MSEFQTIVLIVLASFLAGVFFALIMGWIEGSEE